MSTTQPIRSKQLLHDFKNYYLTEQPELPELHHYPDRSEHRTAHQRHPSYHLG